MNQRPESHQPDGTEGGATPRPSHSATLAVEDVVPVNEGASSQATSQTTANAAVAESVRPARLSGAARFGLILGWGLALLALGAAGWMWHSHTQLRMHTAQDLARLQAQVSDLGQQLQKATQHSAQQTEQAAQLEQKVAAIDTQRQQTEALLHTLAQSQQSALLAEVRTTLQTAQQQAQSTGQMQPLVQALAVAEQRLGTQPTAAFAPQLVAVRQAVAQDLAQARTVRVMDVAQLLAELDALLPGLNTLPLQSQSVPSLQTPASAPKKPVVLHEPQSRWLRLWQSVRESLSQLVRVRTLPSTSAALMAPEQTPYVREHLRKHLWGARMALLLRQPEAAQRDLEGAASLLEQYFDSQSPAVQATQKTLQQVQQQAREAELPAITHTLQALAEAEAALPAIAAGVASSAAASALASAVAAASASASSGESAASAASAPAPVAVSPALPASPSATPALQPAPVVGTASAALPAAAPLVRPSAVSTLGAASAAAPSVSAASR